MKRLISLLMALLLVLTLAPAMAEEQATGLATPAMEMSMEEASKLGLLNTVELPEIALEPFAPDTLDKAIIGADDRVTISNAASYPYSAIAYLVVEGRCGCDWTASGFMVSKDCLMTGAHCVVCQEHNSTANYITMYFGYKSGKNYMLKYDDETTYWYGSNVYSDGRYNTDWDYAYIQLNKPVGEKTGWFGLTALSDTQFTGAGFEVAGYRDRVLKKDWGTTNVRTQYCITHNADTLAGNSGCPVFNKDYYVVAIHVAENTSNSANPYNVARRITNDLINEMRGQNLFD